MKKKKIDFEKEIPFIRRRCPHLKGKELEAAEERFRKYVRICLDIYRREEEEAEDNVGFDSNISEFYNDDRRDVISEEQRNI